MQKEELKFYEEVGDWNFSNLKIKTEKLTKWDFYEEILKHTDENSLCLDIGTGGGENVLKKYPKVGMIIATDFSDKMIQTAKNNQKNYLERKIKFTKMDNLEMKFPNETFDLVSARHTIINAKKIHDCLVEGGALVIEGVDQKDCWTLKETFGRGQAYNDEIAISTKDYEDIKKAGFSKIEKVEILEKEYYETEKDLIGLLLKTPILNDFSEIHENETIEKRKIEPELFNEYVKKNKTEKGILLERVLYGILAIK